MKAKFIVMCISKSVFVSEPLQAASDSNGKLPFCFNITVTKNTSIHQNMQVTGYAYWNVIIV